MSREISQRDQQHPGNRPPNNVGLFVSGQRMNFCDVQFKPSNMRDSLREQNEQVMKMLLKTNTAYCFVYCSLTDDLMKW